jgi:hypothetical protein
VTASLSRHNAPRRLEPEWQAAALNGVLTVIVPAAFAAYLDYTSDAVRPIQPTPLSSAARALPVLLGLVPVALLIVWRTYVHAREYRLTRSALWRGPAESAGIAGGIALIVMVSGTMATWSRQPAVLVVSYIAVYVAGTAFVGLVLGVVLAATALSVLHLRRESARRSA